MDIKKLFLGGIAGSVMLFFLGWLAYVKLFASFFANHAGTVTADRKDMLMMYIVLGNLLHGFLLSFVLVKANVRSLASGFLTGGILGFLFAGGIDSIMYGTSNLLSRTGAAVDVAIVTVMWALAGAVAAALIGMGNKDA